MGCGGAGCSVVGGGVQGVVVYVGVGCLYGVGLILFHVGGACIVYGVGVIVLFYEGV